MYVLDTNIISEVRKPRPHGAVLAWLRVQAADSLSLSAITILELQRGAERTRRQDASKADFLDDWIGGLSDAFSVVALDSDICREAARLMVNKSEDLLPDALIAATARMRRMVVATRNIRDFDQLRVPTYNPFDYKE